MTNYECSAALTRSIGSNGLKSFHCFIYETQDEGLIPSYYVEAASLTFVPIRGRR